MIAALEESDMNILVPIDGSDCSHRALEYAIEVAARFDGSIQVVHITDHRTEATAELLDRAEQTLESEEISEKPEVVFEMKKFRRSNVVGAEILRIAAEGEYDHIVMGHHGTGGIGKAILGSAAETVLADTERPVTVVP